MEKERRKPVTATKNLNIRVTEEQLELWKAKAGKERLTLSDWIRKNLDDASKHKRSNAMEISLNNGTTFTSAHEAMEQISSLGLWNAIVEVMDDEIREKVHAELAPCTEEEFLTRYLELANEDLVIG